MSARRRFEGRELAGAELVIAGTGAELELDDTEHRVGAIVHVVVEAVVDRVTHRPVKDTDKLTRVEHARALVVAFVDVDTVAGAIDAARLAAEHRAGVQRLELT